MCIICSESLTFEDRKKKLDEAFHIINNDKLNFFYDYNTTSILILLYSCIGIHGEDCKKLSISIVKKFIKWIRKNKEELYLPEKGLEPMYHSKILEDVVDWCETYNFEEEKTNCHNIYKTLFDKINEAEKKLMETQLAYHITDELDKLAIKIKNIHKNNTNTYFIDFQFIALICVSLAIFYITHFYTFFI